jgi:hypothetical protein
MLVCVSEIFKITINEVFKIYNLFHPLTLCVLETNDSEYIYYIKKNVSEYNLECKNR